MGSPTPPRFVDSAGNVVAARFSGTQFDVEVGQALAAAIPTLRMDNNRFDTAAARAARKSVMVSFNRP